jgi:outer membrane biosynthesis protein TonB
MACVQASGWQRAYLLWTFRNFRSLPQNILNSRQQRLVEALYGTADMKRPHGLDQDALIGTVDNFKPSSPAPVTSTAAAETIVPSVPARPLRVASNWNHGGTIQALRARLPFSPLTPAVGALVAIMAVLGWQLWRSSPAVSAWETKSAAAHRPGVEPGVDTNKEEVQDLGRTMAPSVTTMDERPVSVAQIAGVASTASLPLPFASMSGPLAGQSPGAFNRARPASNQRGPNPIAVHTRRTVADLGGVPDSALELPRIQISGPPRKIVYPDCPDSGTLGKVTLRAVVDYEGKVHQVRVLTGDRLLAAVAARAIRQWRYQPFSGNEQKPERETSITVSFISSDVVAVSFPNPAVMSR